MKHTRRLPTSMLHQAWHKRLLFRTVVTSLAFTLLCTAPARAFDTFEHIYIGEAAYRKARKTMESLQQTQENDPKLKMLIEDADTFFREVGVPAAPRRFSEVLCHVPLLSYPFFRYCPTSPGILVRSAMDDIPFSFGDLSALAGDYAKTVEDLQDVVRTYAGQGTPGDFERILAVRQHLIGACHWLHQQVGARPTSPESFERECFRRMVDDRDEERYFSSGGYRATREENAALEQTPRYIALASTDQSHFPTHSWEVYRAHHLNALNRATDYAKGKGRLGEALVEEGFAQHFLQDSFSAGHIGSAWGHCFLGIGLFCVPVRGVLQHTHDRLNELGLKVRQAGDPMSQEWMAFGDDHLFAREAAVHREKVVKAAEASILEVLATAVGKPPGAALKIPFPVPADCKLLGCKDTVDGITSKTRG